MLSQIKKPTVGKTAKFAEILTQLRKERKISQKQAAQDLGISQALLSHYEKGIRECGLNFVMRCSEYYSVTTDYLLGASKSRSGIREDYFSFMGESGYGTVIVDATKTVLDKMVSASETHPDTAKFLQEYYMLFLYRAALILAKTGSLSTEIFNLDRTVGNDLTSAAIALINAKAALVEDKSRTGEDAKESEALKQIIEMTENYLLDSFTAE